MTWGVWDFIAKYLNNVIRDVTDLKLLHYNAHLLFLHKKTNSNLWCQNEFMDTFKYFHEELIKTKKKRIIHVGRI